MSTKAQVQTQAKTPAAPTAARIAQPPVAVPECEADRPDVETQLEGAARLGHSLGAISVRSAAPSPIQAKPVIQCQELPEQEEEVLQMKPDVARVGLEGGPVPNEVESAINRARGGGEPLDGALQEQMRDAMGHDFSGVRVHTDSEADQLNQQLHAKAFTTGTDIFFRDGEYSPGSNIGKKLIAHELSHVVQQGTGRVHESGSGMTVRPAGDAFEQEAEATQEKVWLAGARVPWRGRMLVDAIYAAGLAEEPVRPRPASQTWEPIQRDCGLSTYKWHTTSCHSAVAGWLVTKGCLTEKQGSEINIDTATKYYAGSQPIGQDYNGKDEVISYWKNGALKHSLVSTGGGKGKGINHFGTFGMSAANGVEVDLNGNYNSRERRGGWQDNKFFNLGGEELMVKKIGPETIRTNAAKK